jgi:hypothetical protein
MHLIEQPMAGVDGFQAPIFSLPGGGKKFQGGTERKGGLEKIRWSD